VKREYYTVIGPVVNLRKIPREDSPSWTRDDMLLSQLLFNEKVRLQDQDKGWALVEAPEQQTFRMHNRWEGYSGWVRRESIRPWTAKEDETIAIVKTPATPVFQAPVDNGSALFEVSIGTKVTVDEALTEPGRFCPIKLGEGENGWIDKACLRMTGHESAGDRSRPDVLATALLFLGVPYLWGGRSMYMPGLKTIATGVDCSGLVNLVFRAHGIDIPRDAYEQRMKADPVPARELKPGDLIFVARGESAVSHVMLFAGGENFIEAHETGADVRMSTFKERFGVGLIRLAEEEDNRRRLADDREVSFGRILP
jgi:gamma-D-glutamyl-L-lysine dipeptidyl-peptidase